MNWTNDQIMTSLESFEAHVYTFSLIFALITTQVAAVKIISSSRHIIILNNKLFNKIAHETSTKHAETEPRVFDARGKC